MPEGSDEGARASSSTLPRIERVTTRLATYEVPRIFYVGQERKEIRRALEITIKTASRIPSLDRSPILWVGEVPVAEMEAVGVNEYRFYALDPAVLRDGAVIAFGWPHPEPGRPAGSQRVPSNHRLRLGPPAVG